MLTYRRYSKDFGESWSISDFVYLLFIEEFYVEKLRRKQKIS